MKVPRPAPLPVLHRVCLKHHFSLLRYGNIPPTPSAPIVAPLHNLCFSRRRLKVKQSQQSALFCLIIRLAQFWRAKLRRADLWSADAHPHGDRFDGILKLRV